MDNKINIDELDNSYMIFGNKGAVWNGKAHAMKEGKNLCGTPALSTNWARIHGVKEVGCEDCLSKLNSKGA